MSKASSATIAPAPQPRLMSVDEAAARLGISKQSVYELIARHQIPFVPIGTRRMVPSLELEDWIRAQVVRPSSPPTGKASR